VSGHNVFHDAFIVEGTPGNTGNGLAHVCRAMGHKCVIFMSNFQVNAII